MAPRDPPPRRSNLVNPREERRDPRVEEDGLEEALRKINERLDDLDARGAESSRGVAQLRAMDQYRRASTPPGGTQAVNPKNVESEPAPSMSPMGRVERLLKLAGPKAWIVLLVVGSIVACGVYAPQLALIVAALAGTTPSAAEDHALILRHTQEIDELKREDSAQRATDIAIIGHQGAFQSDLSQVLAKLGAEWKMSGLDAPRPTLVDVETKIQTGNKVGKGPWVIVKTPMPTPPRAPEAKP